MRRSTSQSLLALRTWWPALVLGAVVGAAIGPFTTVNAPYSATSELRVDIAGLNDSGQQAAVQTALQLVDSNESYVDALAYEGVHNDIRAAQELRTRAVVASINQSALLSITITAPTVEQAERQADDVAKGAIDYIRSLAGVQFTDTVAAGQKALDAGQVPDKVAEQARREALGQGVAAQQDEALKFSAQLSRVGAVQPAVRAGLGASTAGVVGALAGLLVGAVLALALGTGRRRIRNVSDLRRVGELVKIEPRRRSDGLIRAAARAGRLPHPFVVVLALPGAERQLDGVVESLWLELTDAGRKVYSIVEQDLVPAEVSAMKAETTAEGSLESDPIPAPVGADEPVAAETAAEESYAAEAEQVESTPDEPLDVHFPVASTWAASRSTPRLPSPRPRVSLERPASPEVALEKAAGTSGYTGTATMEPEEREAESQPSFASHDDMPDASSVDESVANDPASNGSKGSNGSGSNVYGSNGSGANGSGSTGSVLNGSGSNASGSNGAGSDDSVSDGSKPDGAVPDGAVPDGAVPNAAVPNGAGPNGFGSNGSASEGSASDGSTSDGEPADGTVESDPQPQIAATTERALDVRPPRPPAVSLPRRAEDLVARGADVLLLSGEIVEQQLADLADRADVVVLVARRRGTRFRHIVKYAGEIETVTPIVVLNDR